MFNCSDNCTVQDLAVTLHILLFGFFAHTSFLGPLMIESYFSAKLSRQLCS